MWLAPSVYGLDSIWRFKMKKNLKIVLIWFLFFAVFVWVSSILISNCNCSECERHRYLKESNGDSE